MSEKWLGRISHVRYGYGGYQDAQFGLTVSLSGKGVGIGDFWGFWGMEPSPGAKWDADDQIRHHGETVERIRALCDAAKVKSVGDLAGKPVEVTIQGNTLESWRILDEVL